MKPDQALTFNCSLSLDLSYSSLSGLPFVKPVQPSDPLATHMHLSLVCPKGGEGGW